MLVLYTIPGCNACKKAKSILKEKEINYLEKNIFKFLLDDRKIRNLLVSEEIDINRLISKNCKYIDKNIDSINLEEIITLLKENPSIINKPIVNYEEFDDIEVVNELNSVVCEKSCPHYSTCGYVRYE